MQGIARGRLAEERKSWRKVRRSTGPKRRATRRFAAKCAAAAQLPPAHARHAHGGCTCALRAPDSRAARAVRGALTARAASPLAGPPVWLCGQAAPVPGRQRGPAALGLPDPRQEGCAPALAVLRLGCTEPSLCAAALPCRPPHAPAARLVRSRVGFTTRAGRIARSRGGAAR